MTPNADELDLREYVERGSRDALGRIARRYVDFVYGVARREIGAADAHLADDITQATFIILSRRASSVRAATLGAWLFTTTRYVASNARKMEARRKYHERRACELAIRHASENAMSAKSAKTQATAELGRDLQDALAAQRESDRAIVLMRFVEGLEFRDIAATIGLSEVATRKRLERGLTRMREFLIGRGVTAESATLGSTIGLIPTAAPASLVAAVSSSTATAPAIALAKAFSTVFANGQLKVAAALLLTIGLAAVIALGTLRSAKPSSSSNASAPIALVSTTPAPASTSAETVVYAGVVTDPSGKPVQGARVWSELLRTPSTLGNPSEAETTTDASGHYALAPLPTYGVERLGESSRRRTLHFDHPAYAMAWCSVTDGEYLFGDESRPTDIQLDLSADLLVKVVDTDGRPIYGAQISADVQKGGRLGQRGAPGTIYGTINLPLEPDVVKTDALGIGTIHRIPLSARAYLNANHPDFENYEGRVAGPQRDAAIRPGNTEPVVITLTRGAKVRVHLARSANAPAFRKGVLWATPSESTDMRGSHCVAPVEANGTLLMTGLRAGKQDLIFHPTSDEKPFGVWQPQPGVVLRAGETTDVTFTNQEGHVVIGRVIDSRTKVPLAGAYLSGSVLQKHGDPSSRVMLHGDPTDSDGRFAIRAVPGEVTLDVPSFETDAPRSVERQVTIPDDAKSGASIDVGEIEVIASPMLRARLVDSSDRGVAGLVIVGFTTLRTAADGSFAMPLRPGARDKNEKYLFALSSDRKLGKAMVFEDHFFSPDLAKPGATLPTIELEPVATVVGTIARDDGSPTDDVDIEWLHAGPNERYGYSAPPWRGASREGNRFAFHHVPVGLKFKLIASGDGRQVSVPLDGLLPGETLDVGEITPVQSKAPRPFDGPADFSGTLKGTVLDENDQPIVGVRVQAHGEFHHSYLPSEDVTDQHGRFTLDRLPREPVMVSVRVRGYSDGDGRPDVRDEKPLTIRMRRLARDVIGKPAPELATSAWFNGDEKTLRDLRGSVVLLYLGANIPSFEKLGPPPYLFEAVTKFKDKGLAVIAINQPYVSYQDARPSADVMGEYVKAHPLPFVVAIDAPQDDPRLFDGQTKLRYDIERYGSAYVVIDKKGIVRAMPGAEQLEVWIQKLLSE